ncbi:MAG: PAS domain-containing protein [Gammaproteobacteria bacterium]|nr:PAS domain-containing protein [Gammaproteobacteria bacterium]
MRHPVTKRGAQRALLAFGSALAVLLMAATAPVDAADSRSIRFRHISSNDGLSQSFVYAILQDRQGYMWFGTQEGLNRFDGFDFTVFAHDPQDPDSISDESVRTIFEDRSGTLWIGTDAGGLSRYDAASQTFTNFLHGPGNESSISDNRVRVIYEDGDGALWVGTDGAGLDRFNKESETFEHFPSDPSVPGSLVGAHVWSILETSDGHLWIATSSGLSRFDEATETFTSYVHDPDDASSLNDNRLRVLYEDERSDLWIGTESGGLNRYDRVTETFERFTHDPDNASSISANRVNTIFQDDAGVLWIGTVDGLNAWNPADKSFDRYRHSASDRYSLAHNTVTSIYQDRGSVFWVGTYDGLSIWNPASRAMLHYKNYPEDPLSLSADTVTSFAEDSGGAIWVATYGGGLNRLDRRKGEFRQIRHDVNDSASLSSDRVMAVYVDRNNVLWAGTRAAGLNRYNEDTNAFTRFQHDADDPDSLSTNGVTYLLEDRAGGLWIGTFGGGLNYFDKATEKFTHFRNNPDDPTSLSSDRVLVLFEDREQYLWIGTYGGGLNRFDPATGQFTRFRAEPDRPGGLSGDEIYMIQEDSLGDLWLGIKGSGLNRWRRADRDLGRPEFDRFTEINGLPSATVYSGVWDESGRLWMSTARGLSRLDITSLEFRNYNASHGLQGEEFMLAAGYRSSDGQLFFGGINGFNAFQPSKLGTSQRPPPIAITRFSSLNKAVDIGDMLGRTEPVTLDYKQYFIGFEFAALDYAAPESNRYMYKLDGFDKDWIDAGTRRQATYTNLPSGDFTFRVRAANNDGIWSEQDANLAIRMNPAPWRTWWAYVLYALALMLLTLAAFRAHAERTRQAAMNQHAEEIALIQARMDEAQSIAHIGNWDWDVVTGELWWSDEIYRLLSLDEDGFNPTYGAFLDFVHPGDRQALTTAIERTLKDGTAFSMDFRIIGRDGTQRTLHSQARLFCDEHGRPERIAGTAHDVTEQKTAQEEISHRADFQALLAELSSELVWVRLGDVDEHLKNGLKKIGTRYDLDAMSLWWIIDDRESMRSLHRWVRSPNDDRQRHLGEVELPWVAEQIWDGHPIVVDDVERMPAAAAIDQHVFMQRGTKSFLIIPLLVDETLEGTCVFSMFRDKRSWSEQTVAELKLLAETIAGAVSRANSESEINKLKEQLQEENLYLRDEIRNAHGFDEIVGNNDALRQCLLAVKKVAPTDVPVLILGETGTGKELIARAVFNLSSRRDKPMVSAYCQGLPKEIIESELFGHEKGAFSGANSVRKGHFELADKGTLFLDKIGDISPDLQSKLLRVLQTGEFERIGSTETITTDVRIIAATSKNLQKAQEDGLFRSDFYYCISSFPIQLPPLRERKGDIPLLAEHFVHKHGKRLGRDIREISARMIRELVSYSWPGNVRELESTIERALISSSNSSVLDLPDALAWKTRGSQINSGLPSGRDSSLYTIERAHIVDVLTQAEWKISGKDGAADMLGMPPSTLRSKMKRLKIERQQNLGE